MQKFFTKYFFEPILNLFLGKKESLKQLDHHAGEYFFEFKDICKKCNQYRESCKCSNGEYCGSVIMVHSDFSDILKDIKKK